MSITRSVAASESPPSVEQVRKQAKRRLIGVAILVMAAVVVFPMLFDTQPRPVPVDMPIEIPSRKVAKPLQVDAPAVAEAPAAPKPAPDPVGANASGKLLAEPQSTSAVGSSDHRAGKPEPDEVIIESTKPPATLPGTAAKPDGPKGEGVAKAAVPAEPAKKEPAPAPKASAATDKPADKAAPPVVRKDPGAEAARALALLEGRPAPASPTPAAATASEPSGTRYIVQVGAFADAAVAQATRDKLERAGLKTYTHVAQLPEGKRTRVRLGPFATRSDAEKAAARAKAQGVSAAILTL